jgi:hypothetical protein
LIHELIVNEPTMHLLCFNWCLPKLYLFIFSFQCSKL